MTLAWTGMRSDEARTLRWSQVDFEVGDIVVGKAKTTAAKGRVIPRSAAVKIAFDAYSGDVNRAFRGLNRLGIEHDLAVERALQPRCPQIS